MTSEARAEALEALLDESGGEPVEVRPTSAGSPWGPSTERLACPSARTVAERAFGARDRLQPAPFTARIVCIMAERRRYSSSACTDQPMRLRWMGTRA